MEVSNPLIRLFNFIKKAFKLSDEDAQEGVVALDEVIKEQVRVHTEHQLEIVRKENQFLQTYLDEKFQHVDERFKSLREYMDEKFYALGYELKGYISENNATQLKWIFLFWIGQVGATLGFLYFIVKK